MEKSESQIKCMYPRRINAELLHCLPITRYTGEIVMIDSADNLNDSLAEINRETILGFDTETRPNFSKNNHHKVSILQFAGVSKVWIIRLNMLEEHLEEIYKVLENPRIKKVGVAVQGDIKSLRERCSFSPAGFFDISETTTKIGVINTGMRNLAALLFGERLSKAQQCSNWAAEVLSDKQKIYAATDAWMSRRLFLESRNLLQDNRITLEPEPVIEPEKFDLAVFIKKTIKKIFMGEERKRPSKRGGRRGGRGRKKSENANKTQTDTNVKKRLKPAVKKPVKSASFLNSFKVLFMGETASDAKKDLIKKNELKSRNVINKRDSNNPEKSKRNITVVKTDLSKKSDI